MTSFKFFGDWHGNTDYALRALRNFPADHYVHVGDFGLWHGESGTRYLRAVNDALTQPIYVIPGNHENWDMLRIGENGFGFSRYDEFGFMVSDLYPNIRVCDRVAVWEWDGLVFAALAGANSIDFFLRTEGRSWWPQESPLPGHVDRLVQLVDGRNVDVLVTHDAPTSAIEGANLYPESPWPAVALRYAHESADVIEQARQRVRPTVHVVGHHHVRRTVVVDGTKVEFLADDSSPLMDNFVTLNT